MNGAINTASMPVQHPIIDFLSINWVNLLLIIVGSFALVIYLLQEHRKVIEAASLIVLQIDELQERVKEIQSYIVNGQLNETAFYESRKLFDIDYWNHYKHYFIRKMDVKSFQTLNSFYDCVAEMQEQQELMKNLQKNFFFVTQQVLTNLETHYILSDLDSSTNISGDLRQALSVLVQDMPQNMDSEQRAAIENILYQVASSNENKDFSNFWKKYNQDRDNIKAIVGNKGLTPYTPLQIRLSLENALHQYLHLEVTGCDGYKMLKKAAKKKL